MSLVAGLAAPSISRAEGGGRIFFTGVDTEKVYSATLDHKDVRVHIRGLAGASAIAVKADTGEVYVAHNGGISKAVISPGEWSLTDVVQTNGRPLDIAIDVRGRLVWSEDDGSVYHLSPSDGVTRELVRLTDGAVASGLTIHTNGDIYLAVTRGWHGRLQVFDGGQLHDLLTLPWTRPRDLALGDDGTVYWSDTSSGTIFALPPKSVEATILVSSPGTPVALAMAGSDLFFSDVDRADRLWRYGVNGGALEPLGPGAWAKITGLAVDLRDDPLNVHPCDRVEPPSTLRIIREDEETITASVRPVVLHTECNHLLYGVEYFIWDLEAADTWSEGAWRQVSIPVGTGLSLVLQKPTGALSIRARYWFVDSRGAWQHSGLSGAMIVEPVQEPEVNEDSSDSSQISPSTVFYWVTYIWIAI